MVVSSLELQSSLGDRHTHTHLDGGFGQPGNSNEEFLLQAEPTKMNQQVRDQDPDHQTNENAGQTQS